MSRNVAHAQAGSFSFRQLRLFESVGRLNSVRRGSEECNLSQPAVTQSLAKLEQLLGHTLLERRTSGSYLTEAGEILHRRTSRMLEQFVDALLDLEVPGGRTGAFTVSRHLTRSQVRALVAIVEHGSFALAAQELGVTQASLQRAIRDLESSLCRTVVYRSASGIVASPEGAELARRLRLAVQEVEWAVQEIEAALGAGESRIVIGALPFGGSVLLASILDEFLANHPKVDLCVITEGATEMLNRLLGGEVDVVVGLTQEAAGADVVCTELVKTPYAIAARRGHPLARRGNLTRSDLVEFGWVVGTKGSARRSCFEALFPGKLQPRAQITTCSLPVIRNLLAGSDRLTLMTSYELMYEASLVKLPFEVRDPVPSIGIMTRASWQPTALHRDFVALLNDRVPSAVESRPVRRVG